MLFIVLKAFLLPALSQRAVLFITIIFPFSASDNHVIAFCRFSLDCAIIAHINLFESKFYV